MRGRRAKYLAAAATAASILAHGGLLDDEIPYHRQRTDVGLSNICYSEHKAEVMTSRGDFHPRGLIGKLLYLRLWSASCTAKSFNE